MCGKNKTKHSCRIRFVLSESFVARDVYYVGKRCASSYELVDVCLFAIAMATPRGSSGIEERGSHRRATAVVVFSCLLKRLVKM